MILFKNPTWIPGERNGGLPGIVAFKKAFGTLRPSKDDPMRCGWRCNGKLQNGQRCKARGVCLLVLIQSFVGIAV